MEEPRPDPRRDPAPRSQQAASRDALEQVRVAALGRKGQHHRADEGPGALAPRRGASRGAALNQLKDEIEAALDARRQRGSRTRRSTARLADRADRRDPAGARPTSEGRIHPISQTIDELDRDLRRDGLHGRRRPAYRGRFPQFHRPQHSARASGAAGAGHLLSRRAPTRPRARCCAPTPRRCRSAPCWRRSRRSASSCPAAPSAATTTRPTRRCSIRSRGW